VNPAQLAQAIERYNLPDHSEVAHGRGLLGWTQPSTTFRLPAWIPVDQFLTSVNRIV
jgi:hypothetical protein